MYIVHITSEIAPVAKVGGLADVVYGLARATAAQGHEVTVLLPKYDTLNFAILKDLKVLRNNLVAEEGGIHYQHTLWSASLDGIKLLLLEPHHPHFYFSRGQIYGCIDDVERFLYFSKACVDVLKQLDRQPDVLHLHDWPTALVAVLKKYRTNYTIHNLDYQGRCAPWQLAKVGINREDILREMADPILPGVYNLMKGAISTATVITTVSPTYLTEILTEEGGRGLHSVLNKNRGKLKGILNGIDYGFWNPRQDPHLIAPYDSTNVVKAREENKRVLRRHLMLEESPKPIVASISRLVPQKGPDLIIHGLRYTLQRGGQFILLGNTPIPQWHKKFVLLKEEFAHHPDVAICLDHDEALAHQIFAGSDMLLMPSIFEPCGLTQLIALRYGMVPIARTTGGLKDTVFDFDTSTVPLEKRNGFTFDFADAGGVEWGLGRALRLWSADKPKWNQLVKQGMAQDYSWTQSAKQYLSLYAAEPLLKAALT